MNGTAQFLGVPLSRLVLLNVSQGCDAIVSPRRLLLSYPPPSPIVNRSCTNCSNVTLFNVSNAASVSILAPLSALSSLLALGNGSSPAAHSLVNALRTVGHLTAVTGVRLSGASALQLGALSNASAASAATALASATALAQNHTNFNAVSAKARRLTNGQVAAATALALVGLVALWLLVHIILHALIASHLRRTCVTAAIAIRATTVDQAALAAALAQACAPLVAKRTLLRPLLQRHLSSDNIPPPGASLTGRLRRALASELAWHAREMHHFFNALRLACGSARTKKGNDVTPVISRAALQPSAIKLLGGGEAVEEEAVFLTEFSWMFGWGSRARSSASAFRLRMRDEETLSALESALSAALAGAAVAAAPGSKCCCILTLLDDRAHAALDHNMSGHNFTAFEEHEHGLAPPVAARIRPSSTCSPAVAATVARWRRWLSLSRWLAATAASIPYLLHPRLAVTLGCGLGGIRLSGIRTSVDASTHA